jgi:hypothetical protein
MSSFIPEDFESLQLTDTMATTRSMTAGGIARIPSVRPLHGPESSRLIYEVAIPDENPRGEDVAFMGLNHERMDLTGIRRTVDGRHIQMDYKLHLTVSVRRRTRSSKERLSCNCGNWSERLPYPCMVCTPLFPSLSMVLTRKLQCMYRAQDDLTRATLCLPPNDFPRSSNHALRMGSENKVDVVLTRPRDGQMFRIDGHDLVRANGEESVVEKIQLLSYESDDEKATKKKIIDILNVFEPIGGANVLDPNSPSTLRMQHWSDFSAYFAEYAKRDPSIVNSLSRLFRGDPPALLALEKQYHEVEMCFSKFDRLGYDERVCKRSLEWCSLMISSICNEAARQHIPIPDRVRASAASTIIYMLNGICSRFHHGRDLYHEIMTDRPQDVWNPIFATLRVIRPLGNDQSSQFSDIYESVSNVLPQELLEHFDGEIARLHGAPAAPAPQT